MFKRRKIRNSLCYQTETQWQHLWQTQCSRITSLSMGMHRWTSETYLKRPLKFSPSRTCQRECYICRQPCITFRLVPREPLFNTKSKSITVNSLFAPRIRLADLLEATRWSLLWLYCYWSAWIHPLQEKLKDFVSLTQFNVFFLVI